MQRFVASPALKAAKPLSPLTHAHAHPHMPSSPTLPAHHGPGSPSSHARAFPALHGTGGLGSPTHGSLPRSAGGIFSLSNSPSLGAEAWSPMKAQTLPSIYTVIRSRGEIPAAFGLGFNASPAGTKTAATKNVPDSPHAGGLGLGLENLNLTGNTPESPDAGFAKETPSVLRSILASPGTQHDPKLRISFASLPGPDLTHSRIRLFAKSDGRIASPYPRAEAFFSPPLEPSDISETRAFCRPRRVSFSSRSVYIPAKSAEAEAQLRAAAAASPALACLLEEKRGMVLSGLVPSRADAEAKLRAAAAASPALASLIEEERWMVLSGLAWSDAAGTEEGANAGEPENSGYRSMHERTPTPGWGHDEWLSGA